MFMKFNFCVKTLTVLVLGSSLAACSSSPAPTKKSTPTTTPQAAKYAQQKKTSMLGTPVPSTNNQCVDHFNFLKEQKTQDYATYSSNYSIIGSEYRFLNTNKNIMDEDARNIYQMSLDMKLNTLCAKVQYSGYQLIQNKIKQLNNI